MNMPRLLLLVCTLSTIVCAQSGQVVEDGVVTDHDYGFTLKSMGTDRVLPEKQARSLAHGALAAILQRRGCLTVLRVEPDLGKNLEQWVALMAKSCGIERLDPLSEFDAAVMGIPAKRFIVNQMKGSDSYRIQHLIVVREGFVYRLTTQKRGEGILDPDEDFVRATDCFRLTKGKVKPRTGGASELLSGAGWEAEGSEYKSAIFGLRAIAPKNFRLMLGDELSNEAKGASVGITNGRVWMALVGHRATGSKKKMFLSQLQVVMEDQFRSLPGEVKGKLLGKNLVLEKLESKGDPHQKVLAGTIFHGKFCIQALIAFRGHNEAEAIAAVPTLLASVKKLSVGLKRKVLARLKELQSLNYFVAPELSVRGWTCRDFKCGFTWTKPSALWTIESGLEARSVLPRARILITNLKSSLMARVVGASAPSGTTLESAHEKELAHYPGKRFRSTNLKVAGHDALMTRKSAKAEIELEYRICTVLAKGRQWHIIFSALPGNMPSAKADLRKALSAFTLHPEGLPAREFIAGVYTDYRTGIRFDSGFSNSKFLQLASHAQAKVGDDYLIKGDGAFCRLMTFCSNGDPGLADHFEAQVRDTTLKDLIGDWPGTPKVSKPTLCGLPSVRTDYMSGGSGVAFHVLRVGDLSVLVIDKQFPEDPRKPLSARISLLP